ncbi:MAG: hypothetical protein ABIP94_02595 [Planctomycetota bacterium]
MPLAQLLLLLAFALASCASSEGAATTLVVASDLDNLPFAGVSADTSIGG